MEFLGWLSVFRPRVVFFGKILLQPIYYSGIEINQNTGTLWDNFYGYGSIYHSGAFYIFGGFRSEQTIARLDQNTHQWSFAGKLLQKNYYHGVVYHDSVFLVIGGIAQKTEKCVLQDTIITCSRQKHGMAHYGNPALFLVPENYGKECLHTY